MARLVADCLISREGRSVSTGAPKGASQNDCATRLGGAEGFAKQTTDKPNASAPGKKWETVLRYLLNVGSLNRFEAETAVHDHCLHTSIASLRRDFGIEYRVFEVVPCLKGRATTKVKRYWLRPDVENLKRVRAVLGTPEAATQ